MRDAMNGSLGGESPAAPCKLNVYSTDIHPVSDELSSLKRENKDLKIELVKMKMRLREIEKSTLKSAGGSPAGSKMSSADKPPLPRKSFINSMSKKLGRLYPFGVTPPNAQGKMKPSKDRRHSIS